MNFEVRCDLQGHLEAAMASEAVGGNMHMDTRVTKVADVNLSSYDLRGYLEATMASEAIMEAICTWIPG